jgi:hypothetical protein
VAGAEVYQATGMISVQLGVSLEEALVRRYARDHNHPLTELAGDVIRGTARITGGGRAQARPAAPGAGSREA